jgi:hypothetical protein
MGMVEEELNMNKGGEYALIENLELQYGIETDNPNAACIVMEDTNVIN